MSKATPRRTGGDQSGGGGGSDECRKRLRSYQTPPTVRRSPRFLPQITNSVVIALETTATKRPPNSTKKPSFNKTHLQFPPISPSPVPISKTHQKFSTKCPREPLRSVGNLQGKPLRRSPRFPLMQCAKVEENKENVGVDGSSDEMDNATLGVKEAKEKKFVEKEKDNVDKGVKKRKMEGFCEENVGSEKAEAGECGGSGDWTKEQDAALQGAYLMAKPSPHFWKKVAKMYWFCEHIDVIAPRESMERETPRAVRWELHDLNCFLDNHDLASIEQANVPGKSSQECFDRVNGSFDTPPQPQPRSRANRSNLSPIANFSLSGSKPVEHQIPLGKKLGSRKKNLVTQKTIRHLLKKHCVNDQNHEADYFSVLETSPTVLSVDLPETNSPISPDSLSSPPGFLQKCSGGRSSAHQKMLSRFKPLAQANNPSPEVLKRIKNVALHEKYIDHCINRDARRKHVAARVDKNEGELKAAGLTAAKTALMSEAREFISHFQQMRANCRGDIDIEDDDEEDKDEDEEDE